MTTTEAMIAWLDDLRTELKVGRHHDAIVVDAIKAFILAHSLQDILSAPKDGTRILAYFPQESMWLTVSFGYYGWRLDPDGGYEFSYEIEGDPTKWIPLPDAPSPT